MIKNAIQIEVADATTRNGHWLLLFVLMWGCLASLTVSAEKTDEPATVASDIPQPSIPVRVFKVTDYGAVGDGKTLDTASLQKAIDACATAGGGTVLLGRGRFSRGRSN